MRTALKWAGLAAGALVVFLILAGAVLYAKGSANITRTYDVPVAPLAVRSDSSALARGEHLVGIYGCMDCHGSDLSGQVLADEGPFRLVSSNLTPAGVGGRYDAAAWDRAIRHGVGADGTALVVMPSSAYHAMSDTDAADLIAYLQTLPPVETDRPSMEWHALGKVLAGGPLDVAAEVRTGPTRATSPAPGATVAYGEYIATMMCAFCHGPDLRGAQPHDPGSPYAPGLLAASQWTSEAFHTALTTGLTPGGRQLDPAFMPWESTARMTPEEREGIRLYLASVFEPGADG